MPVVVPVFASVPVCALCSALSLICVYELVYISVCVCGYVYVHSYYHAYPRVFSMSRSPMNGRGRVRTRMHANIRMCVSRTHVRRIRTNDIRIRARVVYNSSYTMS